MSAGGLGRPPADRLHGRHPGPTVLLRRETTPTAAPARASSTAIARPSPVPPAGHHRGHPVRKCPQAASAGRQAAARGAAPTSPRTARAPACLGGVAGRHVVGDELDRRRDGLELERLGQAPVGEGVHRALDRLHGQRRVGGDLPGHPEGRRHQGSPGAVTCCTRCQPLGGGGVDPPAGERQQLGPAGAHLVGQPQVARRRRPTPPPRPRAGRTPRRRRRCACRTSGPARSRSRGSSPGRRTRSAGAAPRRPGTARAPSGCPRSSCAPSRPASARSPGPRACRGPPRRRTPGPPPATTRTRIRSSKRIWSARAPSWREASQLQAFSLSGRSSTSSATPSSCTSSRSCHSSSATTGDVRNGIATSVSWARPGLLGPAAEGLGLSIAPGPAWRRARAAAAGSPHGGIESVLVLPAPGEPTRRRSPCTTSSANGWASNSPSSPSPTAGTWWPPSPTPAGLGVLGRRRLQCRGARDRAGLAGRARGRPPLRRRHRDPRQVRGHGRARPREARGRAEGHGARGPPEVRQEICWPTTASPSCPSGPRRELLGWTAATAAPQVEVILEHAKVKLVANALGTPPDDVIDQVHAHGRLVAALAGSVKHARQPQGRRGGHRSSARAARAGGHTGDVGSIVLWPEVIDAVAPTPVLAAGGIGSGPADGGGHGHGRRRRLDRHRCGSPWRRPTCPPAQMETYLAASQPRHGPLPLVHRQAGPPAEERLDRGLGGPDHPRPPAHAPPDDGGHRGGLPGPRATPSRPRRSASTRPGR